VDEPGLGKSGKACSTSDTKEVGQKFHGTRNPGHVSGG
jgi:hypothetical protein